MIANKATKPRSYLRGVFTGREGLAPAADVGGEPVGVGRSPRALVVRVRRRWVGHDRIDDPPLLLERVGAAEAAGIAFHRVLEQPLVRLGAVTEHPLVRHLEVDGPRDELVA